jgi:hypothetical protein
MDLEHYRLYRGVTLLAQASLGRISANVISLGVGFDGEEPVVGLHLGHDDPADRQALDAIIQELDEYYDRERTIRSVVTIGPDLLPEREWTYVYLRRDDWCVRAPRIKP